MEEHMTQDAKETLAEEPQETLDEVNEQADAEATDETRIESREEEAADALQAEDRPEEVSIADEVNEPEEGQPAPETESVPFEEDPEPAQAEDMADEDLQSDEIEREEGETIEVEFSVEGIGGSEDTDESRQDAAAGEQGESTDGDKAETAEGDSPLEEGEEPTPTIESVIEAILFASEEPLTDNRLAGIVETTSKQVRGCIKSLNEKYEQNHNAFRIEQIAGGNQMLTLSTYNTWLKKMLKVRSDNKLTPAAMETLAIIAYKQPVIRVDIEAIRGVAVGEVIRSLMYKGLVKIVGRAEILGRPMLYGTTKKFLEVFGLNSLKDLPKAEELKKPD